jgi:hypothetical protein
MNMMMQPTTSMAVNSLLGSNAGGGMSGQGPMSLLNAVGGGGSMEPPPKMLRLDETGK